MTTTEARRRLFHTIRRALEARLAALGHAVALEEDELLGRSEREDLARDPAPEETQLALIELGEAELTQLHAALGRLAAGTYGVCPACGHDIPAERLRALPVAERCIRCQERAERA